MSYGPLSGTVNKRGTTNWINADANTVATIDPDLGAYTFIATQQYSSFVVSASSGVVITGSAAGAGPDGTVFQVEGGTQTRTNGRPILYCQASNSLGFVGVAHSAPKVELDINWMSANDPGNFASNTGGGERVGFGTGSVTPGALYYLNTDGGWSSASADVTGSGNSQLLGLALGSNAQTDGMLIRGWFNATDHYAGAFVPGGAVYIHSGTAAKMSGGAPQGENSYSRIVGYGSANGNLIYFNPGTTWVELTGSS